MIPWHQRLRGKTWGLTLAQSIAAEIASGAPADSKAAVRRLVRELFSDDVELRKRAADVARRITELPHSSQATSPLTAYADDLAGLLIALPPAESRTRWHLGLIVPRIAQNRTQRLRAARIMLTLAEDESNVVRCSAVEGLGTLALDEPSLRDEADAMIALYLRTGTLAMKSRARHWHRILQTSSPSFLGV